MPHIPPDLKPMYVLWLAVSSFICLGLVALAVFALWHHFTQ